MMGGMPVRKRLWSRAVRPQVWSRAVRPHVWSRAAWAATVPVAGVAAARVVGFDRHPALSVANAGTHFVYLPAWGALAVGVRQRRPGLVAVAGAVAAAHVAWTAPELLGRRRAAGLDGTRFRLVTSNVWAHSPDSTPLGEELAGLAADVLLLQELTMDRLADLKATGLFDRFPYSFVDARPGSFGSGIWSRFPLDDGEGFEAGGPPMSRATLDIGGAKVQVFCVHAKAPMRRRWIRMWKTHLTALEGEFRAAYESGPVIMAGDYNSTWGHQPFRQLLAAGLRDAHVDVGRALATTWPRPSLFRIDHVLLSEGVEALAVRAGAGRSSDHRPVVADLLLPALPPLPPLPQVG